MATIGETSILRFAGAIPDGSLFAWRFQGASSFTAQSMWMYANELDPLKWEAGDVATLGIYSDNAVEIGTKLAQTHEITSTGDKKWYGVSINGTQAIVNGTWYWLVIHAGVTAGAGLIFARDTVGGTHTFFNLGTYSTTLPTTLSVPEPKYSHSASVYASDQYVAPPVAVNLIDVELSSAGLHGATVGDAGLHGASIGDAGLHGATVSDSGLYGCTVSDSGLHGVTLSDSSRSS